ncbi:hypothetical protein TOPH_06183 [Tolypocladium ophioglossoides CBS 100239]|uniref:Uncharacterized protein n=1 Tax=Tolypocladium ophioglossoides (strain CBS 100239) TaxID=1163406 RepID=A0A0L0N539_TOLOC|nr:hypothetical protein TOPH_06183 [Tolypocladium ophioglossoides CBS 100239]
MLRRNSSRSKQRRPLGRSKSANSIFRNPVTSLVSIEPFAAERDAHIAATLSYHRAQAQGRHSCDMPATARGPGSCALGRSNSVASGMSLSRSSSVKDKHESPPGNCRLQKKQSVRFAGPNARPRRPLAARANQALLPLVNPRPDAIQHAANGRAQLSSSENGSQPCSSDAARSFGCVDQLPHISLAIDGNVGSMQPSMGRLRKSRSMFTSSIPPTSEFDISDGPTERLKEWLATPRHHSEDKENEPTRGFGAHGLRAPKSMSFLRGHSGHGHSQTSSRADNDLSGHLVPDRLPYHGGSRRRLRSHSSMFFRSKHRRCETSVGLPKSLRNSSNNSAGLSSAFSGNTIPVMKQSGLRVTARKVSRTLKSKFKGLFGRPRSADDMMGATLNFPRSSDSDGESCHRVDDALQHEEASMCRVTSHVPSLHAVPSNQQLRSRQGSLESIRMGQNLTSDDKSRVTSWANSSANTVLSQSSVADWERQRLSVIKENGMHVPSSAVPRPRNPLAGPGAPGTTPPPVPTIDSQRVYSAMLKRLNETRLQEGKADAEIAETPGFVPARSSSVEQVGPQDWSPPTIRCVQADDDVFRDKTRTSSPQGELESPAESVVRGRKRSGSTRSASYKAYPNPTAGDGVGLSPYKFGQRSDLDALSSLAHRSSAFFASPSCHLFRTASPFRRALQETMKEVQEGEHTHALDTRYLSTLSALSLPTRRPSTAGSERDIRMMYAESVYSCATEDARPCQARDDTAMGGDALSPRKFHRHGDATIFVDQPAYKPVPAHSRDFSSASSVEWKTWLSANVSKLETPSTTLNTDTREVSYTLPPFGHVREAAEIESPGDAAKPEGLNSASVGNMTPVKSILDSPRPTSTHAGSKKMLEARRNPSLAVDENSPPIMGERARDARTNGPPAIPSRSSLRTVPSLPSVKASTGRRKGGAGVVLPRMRSLNTIANMSPPARDEQLLKRRARARLGAAGASSAKSSPGLTAAVKRQFGKASTGSPMRGPGWSSEQDVGTPRMGGDGAHEAAADSSDWDAQVMGSKRMVDLFLSSRRKRIKGSKTGTETEGESMSAAFL